MFDKVIEILLQSSWQILILTLLVWPLSRLSVRRYPNFAYILWVVVLVKALFPVSISLPSQQVQIVELPAVITGEFVSYSATIPSFQNFPMNNILVLIWLIGVIILTLRLVLVERAHQQKMNISRELIPEPWFVQMKSELGIGRQIKLYIGESVQSPLTHGLFRVRIYLPEQYKSWESIERQSILAHELIHIQRKDIIVIYLQAIVRILYFFHPAVWLVNDQIDLEREKICDDEAIDISISDRGVYGEQLFKQVVSEDRLHPTSVLASGFFMTDNSILKRFRYIKEKRGNMNNKLKLYHVVLILMVVSMAVVIACSQDTTTNSMEGLSKEIVSADQFTVNGLIWDKEKPYAIINEEIYGAGDLIAGFTITQITDSLIVLQRDQEIVRLEIRKETETVQPIFEAFDTPPSPVGGYAAIQKAVRYPELARLAGIGGTTILQVVIDKQGKSGNAQVLKSAGDASLDSAAIEAALKIGWNPAKKQDEAVAVRISIPIVFKLMTGGSEQQFTSVSPVGKPDWDAAPRPADWEAIGKNIIYPKSARRDGVTGMLSMRFTIDENGNLINPEVVKGPDHPALKEAAVFALNSTKWRPAEKGGIPIAGTLEMGIGFGPRMVENAPAIAKGLRPLDRLQHVPVTIKGTHVTEEAKELSIQIYVNGDGVVENSRISSSRSMESVILDQELLDPWLNSKWEAVPKDDKLEGQWIEVPLEITFIN
ncbi:MAG: M56 family metallopeptidase [Candidatus Marinimicrobia bacterium]|nr:M56 family metallopeptidase [Candidatus Neomarinimicrobiota bacterium]